MATRTLQFYGQGYNPTPCSATVTFNGTQVFSGNIPTLDTTIIDRDPANQVLLFTCEIDSSFSGTVPMTVSVTGDKIYLQKVYANFCSIPNPVYTAEQLATVTNLATPMSTKLPIYEDLANPALSPADITVLQGTDESAKLAVLAAHGLAFYVSSGVSGFERFSTPVRTNVSVTNGTITDPVPTPRPPGTDGEWGYAVDIDPDQTAVITQSITVPAGFV